MSPWLEQLAAAEAGGAIGHAQSGCPDDNCECRPYAKPSEAERVWPKVLAYLIQPGHLIDLRKGTEQ